MINNKNPKKAQFETPFDHIQDVNEFVLAARAYWAERNKSPAWLEPMDEDTAMDYLSGCVAGWIIRREQLPIDSKERMTQIIESVIIALVKETIHRPKGRFAELSLKTVAKFASVLS